MSDVTKFWKSIDNNESTYTRLRMKNVPNVAMATKIINTYLYIKLSILYKGINLSGIGAV